MCTADIGEANVISGYLIFMIEHIVFKQNKLLSQTFNVKMKHVLILVKVTRYVIKRIHIKPKNKY